MVGEVVAWSVVMSDDESGVSLSSLAVGHECLPAGWAEKAPPTPLRSPLMIPSLEPLGR